MGIKERVYFFMENSKTKRKSVLIFSMAALLVLGVASVVANESIKMLSVKAEATTYTFTMDKDHLLTDNVVKVGSTNYTVWLSNDKYTKGTDTFGTMGAGGYLVSCNPLYGIKSITANLVSGSMRASFSHGVSANWERQICINPVNFVSGASSTVSIEGDPDVFYLEFPSETVINSISLTYTCSAITEPTQESNDLLDLCQEAEGLCSAGTISEMVSTTKVSSGSVRSHHFVAPAITTGRPSVLLRLKTPVAITKTGKFIVDGWADAGVKQWLGITCYDSDWKQLGSSMSTDVGDAAWSTVTTYQNPTEFGAVAFIRLGFNLDDTTTVPFSMYLDKLHFAG